MKERKIENIIEKLFMILFFTLTICVGVILGIIILKTLEQMLIEIGALCFIVWYS